MFKIRIETSNQNGNSFFPIRFASDRYMLRIYNTENVQNPNGNSFFPFHFDLKLKCHVSLLWGIESSYDYFLDVYLHAAPFLLPCLAVSLGGQRVLQKSLHLKSLFKGDFFYFLSTKFNTAPYAAP
jgi:hypothetical protein